MECAEADCERPAAVELHIPWAANRLVCAPHGRVLGQREGVVVEALPDSGKYLLEDERD
ncbi:hypothetical protein [Natronobiforma cellulositropha]|uniref:hypothetical protein n=1 Tax=Natronobiforma cellulositropha TaxID=1679076 RepID=UPI0021D5F32C|nr:hypothetical protein [Natronobiforma cellulositropha]